MLVTRNIFLPIDLISHIRFISAVFLKTTSMFNVKYKKRCQIQKTVSLYCPVESSFCVGLCKNEWMFSFELLKYEWY